MFVIRAINITSQTITTIAGTANSPAWLDGVGVGAQFTSPYSIAMSANKQFLFIAEFSGLVRSLRLSDCAYRRFTPLLYCLTFFVGHVLFALQMLYGLSLARLTQAQRKMCALLLVFHQFPPLLLLHPALSCSLWILSTLSSNPFRQTVRSRMWLYDTIDMTTYSCTHLCSGVLGL